jgi:hypothetical protein
MYENQRTLLVKITVKKMKNLEKKTNNLITNEKIQNDQKVKNEKKAEKNEIEQKRVILKVNHEKTDEKIITTEITYQKNN